ncbi:hypothetical protein BDY19DRAFT_998587 [Irpex rosettiformis]|uniref:Uncharacterized protein n=1 Tax=Irpex rosettiformis TaxID=378272 RepID=A0ACB8TN17_9APHY|nr:hypothetical protein BDY19DRAFT_998587 [Irpex rosettiformis]
MRVAKSRSSGKVGRKHGKLTAVGPAAEQLVRRQLQSTRSQDQGVTVQRLTFTTVRERRRAVDRGVTSVAIDQPPLDDDVPNGPDIDGSGSDVPAARPSIYRCAVDLINDWLPFRSRYLDELLRHDGLGDAAEDSPVKCALCRQNEEGVVHVGEYRCKDCDGAHLLCRDCMVKEHRHQSLHMIEQWNGTHFERTSLRNIGLTVYLGHQGKQCPSVGRMKLRFVVCHTNGFHEVDVGFCSCATQREGVIPDWIQLLRHGWYPASRERVSTAFTFRVLEAFHELNLQAKTSLHDYHKTLNRITDNSGTSEPWNFYKQFHIAMRQWRNLMLIKRSARGHDDSSVNSTTEGACAVQCAACPHPGRNLPDNWADAPAHLAWVYVLYLMLDANFRLKLKERGFKDTELSAGWSYFVETSKYERFINSIGDHQENSTCSAEHKAIRNANVPHSGYLVSGTAACLCNRHMLVRANGLGDLQKGERYCTMDYVLLCALVGTKVPVFLTYDIACQYSKNFAKRVREFPPCMLLDEARVSTMRFAIPKKHWRVHGEKDHSHLSLNYLPYSGRTYGEGIETGWSHMNPVSMSTKEMAPSARREVLDDHWSSWNWQKTLGFGKLFLQNLSNAIIMKDKHAKMFTEFTGTFPNDTIEKWRTEVERWEADPLTSVDPFVEDNKSMTFNEVRLKLAREESLESERGIPSPHEVSASAFLEIGLELESSQQTLRLRSKEKNSTADLVSLQTKRNTLRHRIEAWRRIQGVYMPSVQPLIWDWAARNAANEDRNSGANDGGNDIAVDGNVDDNDDSIERAPPEDTPLFLPSSLPANMRGEGVVKALVQKEVRLRIALADDCLATIRRLRRTMVGVSQFKHINVSGAGQKSNTRMRNLYTKFNDKVAVTADRYRAAYAALLALQPNGDWSTRLRPLADKDISGPATDDDRPLGEGHRELSWIWHVPHNSDVEDEEVEFNRSIQIEWTKTRARAQRWAEEVQLIQEEMRRTIVFFEWKAQWWREQANHRSLFISAAVRSGLIAYAEKQAVMYENLALRFLGMWKPFFDSRKIVLQWTEGRIPASAQPQPRRRRRMQFAQDDMDDEADYEDNVAMMV